MRRKLADADENLILIVLLAAVGPPAAFALFGKGIALLSPTTPNAVAASWVSLVAVTLGAFYFSARPVVRRLDQLRNLRLGYLGEREVAEHFQPLLASGYRVFHDVPAQEGKATFNLDHVTIGPAGVAVIEVKTRRKGKARPGFPDHVVTFDGHKLIWPWGEDVSYPLVRSFGLPIFFDGGSDYALVQVDNSGFVAVSRFPRSLDVELKPGGGANLRIRTRRLQVARSPNPTGSPPTAPTVKIGSVQVSRFGGTFLVVADYPVRLQATQPVEFRYVE